MSASNDRFQEFNTVHHLVSRIAHRVHFLKDDERNDFIEMMRRTAEFSGIQLLGWCIMINHFHILIYLPFPPDSIPEEEVIRRVAILKGKSGGEAFANWIASERAKGNEDEITRALDKQRRRMYDIGEYMKILKQWFTQEYNRRYSHVGTLWESSYHDIGVKMDAANMSRVLSYIHLNPIRAAACAGFDDYLWSSLNAAVRGDPIAIAGLNFVYGEEFSSSEVIALHHEQMNEVLEYEKRKRAQEVARKRAAGYEVPNDALTDEAYVAQAAAHLEKVVEAGVELYEEDAKYKKCAKKREEVERRIIDEIRRNPRISSADLAALLGIPHSTMHNYVSGLQKRGAIFRAKRNAPWSLPNPDLGQT